MRAWHVLALGAKSEHWISQEPSVPQAVLSLTREVGALQAKGPFLLESGVT